MNPNKKMKLSDLQPGIKDGVNWDLLDNFFQVDGPATLAQALVLTNIIKESNILSRPEVDSSVVLGYLTGIANDTKQLSDLLAAMTAEYEISKKNYKGNYNENAHMFSITISYSMTEWASQYEETVAQNITDVVDYINSIVPSELAITPPQQGTPNV